MSKKYEHHQHNNYFIIKVFKLNNFNVNHFLLFYPNYSAIECGHQSLLCIHQENNKLPWFQNIYFYLKSFIK